LYVEMKARGKGTTQRNLRKKCGKKNPGNGENGKEKDLTNKMISPKTPEKNKTSRKAVSQCETGPHRIANYVWEKGVIEGIS